jgi:SulP family sulfate permease
MSTASPMPDAHRQIPTGAWRYVPALDALRTYTLRDARADLVAGLTVASVAVPQAIAYAILAGVPPEHGLYTAIVMTAVGAFFDSSRQLINGPTNVISIAVFSTLATATVVPDPVTGAVALALLIGAFQLAITLLRLGDLTRYISHSVVVGFTAGASVLLLIEQAKNLVGKKAMGHPEDHLLVRFYEAMVHGGPVHGPTLAVAVGAIGLLLALRWVKRRIGAPLLPDMLIVVVTSIVAVQVFDLEAMGVKIVGDIPARLPSPRVPTVTVEMLRELSPSALAIATLGLLEAIAMAKSIAAHTRQKLDLNQQCLSEGAANLAGAFFQCIPGSGSLTRSAINQAAGGVSQWSGIVSAVAVAGIVMVFAPWAAFIPKSALAGLLVVTAARMIDPAALLYHVRASRFDAGLVVITALSAIVVSVEFCVLIGVFFSFLLAVPRAGRISVTEFVLTDEGVIHERMQDEPVCSRILLFGLEGELFFGAAADLETRLEEIEERVTPDVRVVVLRLKRARNPDAVCLHLLDHFCQRVQGRGARVLVCGVRDDLYEAMIRTGVHLEPSEIFREQQVRNTSTLMAVRHAYDLVGTETCAHCVRKDPAQRQALYYAI